MVNGSRLKHVALIGATGGLVVAASASGAFAASSSRAALPGAVPGWAKAAPVRHSNAAAPVALRVYLAPRGGVNAVKAAVAAVSTPGSAQYHRFMTPAAYRAKFAPSAAQVSKVSAWLRASGLKVTGVEASHRYISASGTVAAAERAFGVNLNVYRRAGKLVRGASTAASVPSAVAGSVLGVSGLSASALVKPMISDPPPPAFLNARPCSLSYGQISGETQGDFKTKLPKFKGAYRDYAVCGYIPSQFRSAYGVNKTTLTGKGATIGIVDAYAASTIEADANRYANKHGDAKFAAGQFSQVLPKKFGHATECDPPGWAGEETLDVEASHGMAGGANVVYYAASSCENSDIETALARAVDQDKVTVISNSYGNPDSDETAADIVAEEQIVFQGELQGITFLFSSGDNGDEALNTGLVQTDYPASDPWVTAVGGTASAIGPDGSMLWQTGWGTKKWVLSADGKSWEPSAADPFLYGSGGGFSTLFNRPAYQKGVVTGGSPAGRGVPDVALDGDVTTGMLVGETQTFPNGVRYGEARYGGTSLATPLMAGMVAMATEHATTRLGFLNPAVYAQTRAHAGTFTDVLGVHTGDANVRPDYANGLTPADGILYSIRTFNQDSSLVTKAGWDDVTGVGTPNTGFLNSFSK